MKEGIIIGFAIGLLLSVFLTRIKIKEAIKTGRRLEYFGLLCELKGEKTNE